MQKKIRKERQFNRQVETNIRARQLKREITSLEEQITAIKAKTTNKIGLLVEKPYFCNVEQRQKYGNDKRTSSTVAERGQAEEEEYH